MNDKHRTTEIVSCTSKQTVSNEGNEKYNIALQGYMNDLVERFGSIPLSPDNARIPPRADTSTKLPMAPSLSPHSIARLSRWSNSSPAVILSSAVALSESYYKDLGKFDHCRSTHINVIDSSTARCSTECSPRTPRRTSSMESVSNRPCRWVGPGDKASPSQPLRRYKIWGDQVTTDHVTTDQVTTDARLAIESPGTCSKEPRESMTPVVWVDEDKRKKPSKALSSSSYDLMKQSRPPRLPDLLRLAPY